MIFYLINLHKHAQQMKKFLWNIALECVRRDSVIAHSRLWPSFTSLPYGESVNSPEGDTFSSIAKFLTAPCFSLSFLTATMAFSLQKSPPPQKNTGIFSHDRQSDFVWVFRKLAHTMYIITPANALQRERHTVKTKSLQKCSFMFTHSSSSA